MKEITEDYVSFEIAKLLKEKGFDWECRTRKFYPEPEYDAESPNGVYAPTHQTAIKWLREVHKWSIQVFPVFDNLKWCYDIYELKIQKYHDRPDLLSVVDYDTYEEACETAIKYVLENLI